MAIVTRPDIWGKVSDQYDAEPQEFERGLAREIISIFSELQIRPGCRLLEAGCGSGHLSLELNAAGYKTTLFDFEPKAIAIAKKSFQSRRRKGRFIQGDLFAIEESVSSHADVVWNSGVLEHFDYGTLVSALGKMKSVAKKGVFFIVPNPASVVYLLYRMKMLREERWNVGVEFLRTDYEKAIAESGLYLVKAAPCGHEYSKHSVRAITNEPAIQSLFHELIDSGQFSGNVDVLQYFYCTTVEGPRSVKPVQKDEGEQLTFDRTFYLDALGTVNSVLLTLRREKDRLQSERDAVVGSQEGLRQTIRDEQVRSRESFLALENQLTSLRKQYEQVLASEAMHRQAAVEQREMSERAVAAMEEKSKVLEAKYEQAVAADARQRQAASEQQVLAQSALSLLEGKLSAARENNNELRTSLEAHRQEANEERANLRTNIALLEAKLAAVSARHDQVLASETAQRQAVLEEQGRLRAEITSLEKKLQAMTDRYEQAAAGEAAQRESGGTQRAMFESTISSLEEKIDSISMKLERSIAAEATQRQAAVDQRKQFEKDIAALQDEIESLLRQRSVDREEKQSARDRVRELQREIRELQQDAARLSSTIATQQRSAQEEQKRLEEYRTAVSALVGNLRETASRGQTLFEKPSYRLFWFVTVVWHVLFGGDWKTKKTFFRLLAARLRGKAGALAEFLYLDPLWEVLQRIRHNVEEYQRYLTPQVPPSVGQAAPEGQPEFFPELRRAVKPAPASGRKRVAYFTNQLLDWFDKRPRHGGGERYCLMLTSLLNDLGFEVDLFQIAASSFEGEYYGHKVRAIPGGEWYSEFNLGAARRFYELSREYDHVIYNMPELSAGPMRTDALSICHGIWFDHNNYGSGVKFREGLWYQHLQRAFSNPRAVISVDTNSVNVIRTLWPEAAKNMRWIPNFVDTTVFKPPASPRPESPLLVLFPRRSQINRGSRLLEDILHRVDHDVKFHWVGEGDDPDTKIIKDLSVRDPRLEFSVAAFEDMPKWFNRSHICVIPTIACEGTSLACLEALASGCATVSTNVGGLPDLIQDRSNGLLVDPTAEAIAEGINELIENRDLREQMARRGVESAENFSVERWRERWKSTLHALRWIQTPPSPLSAGKGTRIHAEQKPKPRMVIVTRNGYHGGVETLVHVESLGLNAPIIVAGGLDDPQRTCPFFYTYVRTYEELREKLKDFDVVLYHWPIDWAVAAIKDSGLPSAEYVHRKDTAECDKSAASVVITHSQYLADFLKEKFRVDARVTNNVVDLKRFYPAEVPGTVVGSVTSYYDTKGIDILLRALTRLSPPYRNMPVELYGAGSERDKFAALARSLHVDVKFNPPTSRPLEAYHALAVYVSAARIEGLPLAVLEALACNIPVIASDIEGHAVINRLAKSHGLPEPILLFRSEDEEDLAGKIEDVMGGYRLPKGREVVERLFSPDGHLRDVRSALNDALSKKARRPVIEWQLLDDCENTGTLLVENGGEGFFQRIGGREDRFLRRSAMGRLPESSFGEFICYRYRFPRDIERLSCIMQCTSSSEGTVHVQFDWHDRHWSLVKMQGFGRALAPGTRDLYMTAAVPMEATNGQGYVNIVFRPNTGFTLTVRSVRIQAWKKILKR